MPPQKVVHRNVPFAAELEPIGTVPPIRVEVSVGEASELSEGATEVFPDDEEHQKEDYHEWEEK